MTKQYKIDLVFGSDKQMEFQKLKTEKDIIAFFEEYKNTYIFSSKKELKAFKKGVEEAIGFLEFFEV